MSRSYLSRGLSLIGSSSWNLIDSSSSPCNLFDSSSARDAAATSSSSSETLCSRLPFAFLGEHSLEGPNYSTHPPCNNDMVMELMVTEKVFSSLHKVFRIANPKLYSKEDERYKPLEGRMFPISGLHDDLHGYRYEGKAEGKAGIPLEGRMFPISGLHDDLHGYRYEGKAEGKAGIAGKMFPHDHLHRYRYEGKAGITGEEKRRVPVGLQQSLKNFADGPDLSSTGPTPRISAQSFWANMPKSVLDQPKPKPTGPPLPPPPQDPVPTIESPIASYPDDDLPEYYVFVLQHGKSVRHLHDRSLWSSQSDKVTPHGLWPQNSAIKQGKDFKEDLIPDINSMCKEWPDVLGNNDEKSHVRFWKAQWNKHGRESPMAQTEYMAFVVKLKNYFGPIIDDYLDRHTRVLEKRRYLDITSFVRELKLQRQIFVTLHGNTKVFKFNDLNVEFQLLSEVRIYLDGKDPYITRDPKELSEAVLSKYELTLEMNVIVDTECL